MRKFSECRACTIEWYSSWELSWKIKNTQTDIKNMQTETQEHRSSLIPECQVYCAPGNLT